MLVLPQRFRHFVPRSPSLLPRSRGLMSRALLCACALLLALATGGAAGAQTAIVDTGPGDSSGIGAPSLFNNNLGFQHLGGRFTLAQTTVIGTVEGWMATPGGTLQARIRSNIANQPGTVLHTASQPVPFSGTFGWTSFTGLSWSLPAGTYWVTFEPLNPTPGFGSMPIGAPNPLAGYSFLSDGNPGWNSLSPGQTLGIRIFTPGGGPPVLAVPGDHATIQAAINAALPSQVIEVAPGTYPEALNFGGKTITVRSASGAAVTTIDATGKNLPAVTVGPGSAAGTKLEGFTIRGGSAFSGFGYGGGVFANASTLLVEDCVLRDNAADSGGGAAAAQLADVTYEGCTIRGNHADVNGGGVYVNNATVTLTECTLTGNDASQGGGLNVNFQGDATLTDCRITKNTAVNSAGGVLVIGSTASATLTACSIEENTAPGAGGAGVNGASASFFGCDFLNNLATFAGPVSGGGLQAQGAGTLLVAACDFTGNRAANGAGALLVVYTGSATFTGCDFAENVATTFGGGLACTNGSPGALSGCTFSNNQGLIGGGVFAGTGTALSIGGTAFCGNAPNATDGPFTNNGGNSTTTTCTGWTDLGYALEGTGGVPLLAGSGSLVGGQAGTLALIEARPSAPAVCFVGFTKTLAPFKGGTLIPVPPAIAFSLTTDAGGSMVIPFFWPLGLPSGFDLYFQYAVQDPAAVNGVALSNALHSESP
jgi:predicted outer membrane repeat protein